MIGVGWEAIKRNPVELIGGYFVTMAVSMGVGQVPTVLTYAGLPPHWLTTVFFTVISTAIGAFFMVGQVRACLAAAREQPVEFGVFFSGADRFLVVLLVQILWGLGIALGLLLLIVPGIIVTLGWLLAFNHAVDSRCGPVEALAESWRLTQGEKGKLFVLMLALGGISILGACACYVGLFVAVPIVNIATATVYLRLSGQ